jgi:hypothetical protein
LSYDEKEAYQPLNLQLAKESYKKIQELIDALDEKKQGLLQASQLLDQESATMSSIKEWIKDWEKVPLIVELCVAETLLEDPYHSFKEKEKIKEENATKRLKLKQELLKKGEQFNFIYTSSGKLEKTYTKMDTFLHNNKQSTHFYNKTRIYQTNKNKIFTTFCNTCLQHYTNYTKKEISNKFHHITILQTKVSFFFNIFKTLKRT